MKSKQAKHPELVINIFIGIREMITSMKQEQDTIKKGTYKEQKRTL